MVAPSFYLEPMSPLFCMSMWVPGRKPRERVFHRKSSGCKVLRSMCQTLFEANLKKSIKDNSYQTKTTFKTHFGWGFGGWVFPLTFETCPLFFWKKKTTTKNHRPFGTATFATPSASKVADTAVACEIALVGTACGGK